MPASPTEAKLEELSFTTQRYDARILEGHLPSGALIQVDIAALQL